MASTWKPRTPERPEQLNLFMSSRESAKRWIAQIKEMLAEMRARHEGELQ